MSLHSVQRTCYVKLEKRGYFLSLSWSRYTDDIQVTAQLTDQTPWSNSMTKTLWSDRKGTSKDKSNTNNKNYRKSMAGKETENVLWFFDSCFPCLCSGCSVISESSLITTKRMTFSFEAKESMRAEPEGRRWQQQPRNTKYMQYIHALTLTCKLSGRLHKETTDTE